MLEFLRNGVRSWYFKALLGVLVVSFAIFGVGDIFQGGIRSGAVIEVGDVEVGPTEVGETFRRQLNVLTRRLGSDISPEQARQLGITNQVVESLITQALYDSEASALGVVVTKDPIANQIRSEAGFRNQLGQFDRGVYEQTLAVNGYTEQQFVAQLRRELSREQVVGSLTKDVQGSTQLANRLYRWRQEKRIADFIVIENDPNATVDAPDDAALQAYHKENERLFTAPEYRNATYIHLSGVDVLDDITIPDTEIRELYENRIDQFRVAEQRTVQQMVFPTEKAAKEAIAQLAEGIEFAALAKKLLNQDADATNLGDVTRDSLPDELADPVFALSKDQTSAPLKGPFGWHVMQVTGTRAETTQPFADVRATLRTELAQEKSLDVLFELANALEDSLGGGASLEEAASQIGVSAKKVAMVDRRGRDTNDKPILTIPIDDAFLTSVFSTESGEESSLIELGSNGYLLVRVDRVTPSRVKLLDTVREQAIAAWQAEQRLKLTEEKTKAALDRIKGGETLAAIAGELAATIQTSAPFNREGQGAGSNLPRALVSDIFAAKIGGAASSRAGTGHTIAVLKRVEAANPNTDSAAVKALQTRLGEAIASDVEVQYNNALRQHHTVTVDQRAIDTIFLQF
ncbi:MAG: hypothetical protein GKS00_20110 [Alphaproteobacteria bacterium]|nr:hypothetical protein [Alphaproteobacteria bacterium]